MNDETLTQYDLNLLSKVETPTRADRESALENLKTTFAEIDFDNIPEDDRSIDLRDLAVAWFNLNSSQKSQITPARNKITSIRILKEKIDKLFPSEDGKFKPLPENTEGSEGESV